MNQEPKKLIEKLTEVNKTNLKIDITNPTMAKILKPQKNYMRLVPVICGIGIIFLAFMLFSPAKESEYIIPQEILAYSVMVKDMPIAGSSPYPSSELPSSIFYYMKGGNEIHEKIDH